MTNKNNKSAIILAAGRGKRLMPYTAERPKCLVEVGGKPILFYQLRALAQHGIGTVTIVTGYRGDMIEKYATTHFPDTRFQFIRNDDYETTNDIYSFYLARKFLRDDVILLDSDVLFHPAVISKIAEAGKSAVGIQRVICGEEEMKVVLASDNTVARLSKALEPKSVAGEFMGVSLFTKDFSERLVPALEELINSGELNFYREVAIEEVIASGRTLLAVDATEYPAIEIDFPEDLKRAEEEILPKIINEFNI